MEYLTKDDVIKGISELLEDGNPKVKNIMERLKEQKVPLKNEVE